MAAKTEREKRDEKIGCIVLVLITIAIVVIIGVQLIPLIVPFAFAICALVFFIKYMWKDRPHVHAKFQLSDSEIHLLSETAEKYVWALEKVEELKKVIADEGLRYTAGGKRLELRSHRAQDVQGAMDNANNIIAEVEPRYYYLRALPMNRYKASRKHFARFWGFLLSFVIWGIIFMPQHNAMLNYHLEQTGEAIGFVVGLVLHDSQSDNQKETIETVAENTNEKQDAIEQPTEKKTIAKPDITVWEAFVTMLIVYLVMFLATFIFFSIRHKKPKE